MQAKLLIAGVLAAASLAACADTPPPKPETTQGTVLEVYQRCPLINTAVNAGDRRECNRWDIVWMQDNGPIWTLTQNSVPPVWKGFKGKLVILGGNIDYAVQNR
jgi:hypothetical protein